MVLSAWKRYFCSRIRCVAVTSLASCSPPELTRLESHLSQMRALLDAGGPVGRKLEFLVQELNREVNTVGSKSQNAAISARVVDLKAELERVREQIANVE